MNIKLLASVIFTLVLTLNINAQKYGFINSTELLSMHPNVKTADSLLNVFQNGLMTEGQKMVDKFQKDYEAYMKDSNSGNLSKLQMQERESSLVEAQNKIKEYDDSMQQKVVDKREELYKPILNQIQIAINEIGLDNNYTFIFDSGAGGLLFAEPADNLIGLVKTKLGIK